MVDVPATFGALLIGAFIATALSGVVTTQVLLYMKLFPIDEASTKAIVAAVWTLDTGHTCLVLASIWIYFIQFYGESTRIDEIPKTLAITIQLTAILTFIVHCFYSRRIHKVSRGDWRITLPILIFAFLRLCSATLCTAEMIHTKTFTSFRANFRWLFTLGLALSCLVDILISVFLTYALQSNRRASTSLDHVINSVILYTLETGSLTGAATVISMIFWLVMPYNLIFMGMHFVISKLYANSLLATCVLLFLSHSLLTQIVIFYSLNSRRLIQQEHETHKRGPSGDLPVAFPGYANRGGSKFAIRDPRMSPTSPNSLTRPLANQPRLNPMETQVRELTSSAPAGA
ncbi:hypothetical protein SCLCIDRAFT_23747 [Scleroderma citrinum Foug A]|uniref:DUF6534 domain-containing protein n=1 Tax=Scleroderma citrinum Foug A TaxID=1036808 RepID=A0A0C3DU61_9AGAM|nr:hypothetical protein SCLCIDRAFT_23747 [Scleroderma citrinum Foug A]